MCLYNLRSDIAFRSTECGMPGPYASETKIYTFDGRNIGFSIPLILLTFESLVEYSLGDPSANDIS